MTYAELVERKSHAGAAHGFDPLWMPEMAFPFQKQLIDFAVRRGRGAIFADCGLGKTLMNLAFAENVVRKSNKPVLMLTPLAVGAQTVAEAEKFGVAARRSRDGKFTGKRVVITNYERLHYFDPSDFGGVVCDESSAIKNFNGERKAQVTEFMKKVPYRLLATATAAPNDYVELGTSSEALGELGYMDMLNRFFRNDNNTSDTRTLTRRPISHGGPVSSGWRFKGHAEQHFWKYVSTWARACRKPSDLGFDDAGFILPPLEEVEHLVETKTLPPGMLFPVAATNNREEREECRRTIQERCEKAAALSIGSDSVVLWCHLNDEGDLLEEITPGSRQITGATPEEEREEIYAAFASGQLRALITKDKIGAWGLNWQHCNRIIRFPSHSFEGYYQAVRRCWRFGQKRPVRVDMVVTEGQLGIKENQDRKAALANRMVASLIQHMNEAMKITGPVYAGKVEVPIWLS